MGNFSLIPIALEVLWSLNVMHTLVEEAHDHKLNTWHRITYQR